jgi:hypothetical protein
MEELLDRAEMIEQQSRAILETSGIAALDREASRLRQRAAELYDIILETPARSAEEALQWQLRIARDFGENYELIDVMLAGIQHLMRDRC